MHIWPSNMVTCIYGHSFNNETWETNKNSLSASYTKQSKKQSKTLEQQAINRKLITINGWNRVVDGTRREINTWNYDIHSSVSLANSITITLSEKYTISEASALTPFLLFSPSTPSLLFFFLFLFLFDLSLCPHTTPANLLTVSVFFSLCNWYSLICFVSHPFPMSSSWH